MIADLMKQIESSYYWDARVKKLDCNYFGDEVNLIFEDGDIDVVYHFEECYQIQIIHSIEYTKTSASKELTRNKVPYFMQDVQVEEITINEINFLQFKINLFPIDLHILCKTFKILTDTPVS